MVAGVRRWLEGSDGPRVDGGARRATHLRYHSQHAGGHEQGRVVRTLRKLDIRVDYPPNLLLRHL